MAPPNWEKIKDIYVAVAEQPAERREEFLSELCGDDIELHREIKSLLEANSAAEPLIDTDNYSLASALLSKSPSYEGKVFGHYRIIRQIGRGGMGAVFLAERADGEFNQQVALKIVRRSFADPELSHRFRRERQILATLNHPNIARLLDGGVSSDDDEPYLVMEHVEGSRIDDYCRENNLPLDERLKLFLQVCNAVSFSHQNLVVHRDIKPSNILVTTDGVPKLLDFGIAKLLDADLAGEQTQTNFRAFTPEYASPEQIRGEQITTATDVYSLGVLLSKIIQTDEFNAETGADGSGGRALTSRPRQATQTREKAPESELEAILQMARRAEPARRYTSVQQFADDICRYLEGLPVLAQKDSFAYRAKKFFKRNKFIVSTTVLVAFSLIIGFGATLWQWSVARQERDRAEKRFAEVRELSNALLTDIAPKIERLPGSTEARQALVQQSLKYLDNLAQEEAGDDIQLQSELAAAYEKIGDLQGNPAKPNLGDFSGAIASYEKANAIRQRLPQSFGNKHLLGENFRVLSSIRFVQNDIEGSLRDSAEALKIYEFLLAENPAPFEMQAAYIETLFDQAQTYSSNNQYAVAIPLFQQAIVLLEKIDLTNQKTQVLSAKGFSLLGNALSWDGKQTQAETEMQKAVARAESLAAAYPHDANIQQTVWRVYILASSIHESINNETSLAFAQKAMKTAEKAVMFDPADTQAKHNLAKSYSRMGIISALLDQMSEATAYLNKTETILTDLVAREPKNQIYHADLGRLYTRFGDTREKQNDLQGSLRAFQKSAQLFENLSLSDEKNTLARRDLAQSLKSAGNVYLKLSEKEAARENYQKALEILNQLKEQNALGQWDEKLFEEVIFGIQKTE